MLQISFQYKYLTWYLVVVFKTDFNTTTKYFLATLQKNCRLFSQKILFPFRVLSMCNSMIFSQWKLSLTCLWCQAKQTKVTKTCENYLIVIYPSLGISFCSFCYSATIIMQVYKRALDKLPFFLWICCCTFIMSHQL